MNKKKAKENINIEYSIIELINKFFWKSKIGPIGALVLPLAFMLIYKIMSFVNGSEDVEIFNSGLPTYLTLSVSPIALITLPQIMVELKNSIVLRKISISKVSALNFSLLLIGYIFVAQILSLIIVIISYATLLNVDAPTYMARTNWGDMIFALLCTALLSLSIGYALGVFIKKTTLPQLFGFIILLLSATLAGQFVPLHVIANSEAARVVAALSPLSYPMSLINCAALGKVPFETIVARLGEDGINNIPPAIIQSMKLQYDAIATGSNIFDIHTTTILIGFAPLTPEVISSGLYFETTTLYHPWQKIMNLLMPWVLSAIFFIWSLIKFNWTSR